MSDKEFVEGIIRAQKEIDARARERAKEIVESRNLKTLDEATRFARSWIETAAQCERNWAYWEKRALVAEEMLRAAGLEVAGLEMPT